MKFIFNRAKLSKPFFLKVILKLKTTFKNASEEDLCKN